MNDIILIMISYTLIIFLSFGILAFLQAGFLIPFLKVKTSRGKKILVRIRNPTGSDFVASEVEEGMLKFKYLKNQKKVSKYEVGLYRAFNINCVDLDGKTWGVINTSFEGVSTNDPTKTDHLIERALMRPVKKTTREVLILLFLALIFLGVLFIAYKMNFLQQSINLISGVGGTNL